MNKRGDARCEEQTESHKMLRKFGRIMSNCGKSVINSSEFYVISEEVLKNFMKFWGSFWKIRSIGIG